MDAALTAVVAVIGAAFHLPPSLIAFNRSSGDRWLVLVVNGAFGATLVGWVLDLCLPLREPRVSAAA
ncbi:superinfection immunity protein [Streptomyces sp. NPDC097727]|uniref:superinfection immunity protein n=1 Tax=Streptomyces sp. NPDC097727 TaxID=3366092 RepID=UPI00380120F6